MEEWKIFELSGSVYDYLEYVRNCRYLSIGKSDAKCVMDKVVGDSLYETTNGFNRNSTSGNLGRRF